jgi:hypothetical protein
MDTEERLQRAASNARPIISDVDIDDSELLAFALSFVGQRRAEPIVAHLLNEFGDAEVVLASTPEELRYRGGLCSRAVAILKLLHAFRTDNRRGMLLH